VDLHPGMSLRLLTIGNERAPLLVIDDFVADADELVRTAAAEQFAEQSRYYPGIRAAAPQAYQDLISARLASTLAKHFDLRGTRVHFSLCHFAGHDAARAARDPAAHSARGFAAAQRACVDPLSIPAAVGRHGFLPPPQDGLRVHRRIAQRDLPAH